MDFPLLNRLNLNILKSNKGLAPGTPVFVGNQKTDRTTISMVVYNKEEQKEYDDLDIQQFKELESSINTPDKVIWIRVIGIHDVESIQTIGEHLGLHKLLIEDILNTQQRSKFEVINNYLFAALKAYHIDENRIEIDNISLVLKENRVITFEESKRDALDLVKIRILKKAKIIERNSGYLIYALMDSGIDEFNHGVDLLMDRVASYEERIFTSPSKELINEIYMAKRSVNQIIKVSRPTYEYMLKLNRMDSLPFDENTLPFLNDLKDNITYAYENVVNLDKTLMDQINLYHTTISTNLNDVMKILTLFSVIFIPITFLAGVYGMNWENLPELHYKYGYLAFWIIALVIAISMIIWFRRRKWL